MEVEMPSGCLQIHVLLIVQSGLGYFFLSTIIWELVPFYKNEHECPETFLFVCFCVCLLFYSNYLHHAGSLSTSSTAVELHRDSGQDLHMIGRNAYVGAPFSHSVTALASCGKLEESALGKWLLAHILTLPVKMPGFIKNCKIQNITAEWTWNCTRGQSELC